MVFVLSTVFCFSQASNLTVYNSSPVTVQVVAGVASNCSTWVGTTSVATIPPGGNFSFAPLGAATDFWYGFKAWDPVPGTNTYGSFHNPCPGACGVDNSMNLNVTWDIGGGCFDAKVY